jgi:hypothetical protein
MPEEVFWRHRIKDNKILAISLDMHHQIYHVILKIRATLQSIGILSATTRLAVTLHILLSLKSV